MNSVPDVFTNPVEAGADGTVLVVLATVVVALVLVLDGATVELAAPRMH